MHKQITVVGLGPGSSELVSQGALEALTSGKPVYFRTKVHPVVPELEREIPGSIHSFDHVYDSQDDFADVYTIIVEELLAAANDTPLIYAVPGHPMVAETTVRELMEKAEQAGVKITVVPSMSGIEAVIGELRLDPTDGLAILDALNLPDSLSTGLPLLITQVYSRFVASELKLALMDYYPAEHSVTVITAAGIVGQTRKETHPLYELDQVPWVDHLTTLYVPRLEQAAYSDQVPFSVGPLVKIMERLRGEGGCAWDRKQTHASLKPYLIEESYEVLEAIDADDDQGLMEELGDVLLQIIFHAQVARERGAFGINEIMYELSEKLIRRHPHVFGDVVAETTEQVSRNWDAIKRQEKAKAGAKPGSLLDGVPRGLPALMAAEKLQRKAAKVGFEWDDIRGAWEKVQEELSEFSDLFDNPMAETQRQEEFGDILFALTNIARYLSIDPEMALMAANQKFKQRFRYIEAAAKRRDKELADMSLAEMDELWDEAKTLERS